MGIAIAGSVMGLLLAVSSLSLFRRGLLSFRYCAGWLLLGVLLALSALLSAAFKPSKTQLLEVGGSVMATLILALLVQLSISVSGLQRQLRDVAEAQALITMGSGQSSGSTASPANETRVD